MEKPFAEGGNYKITVDAGGVATCRVWKRPDLSFTEGARLGGEIASNLIGLASRQGSDVKGLILDLREAPPMGTKTRDVIAKVLAECEARGRRFVLMPGSRANLIVFESLAMEKPPAFVKVCWQDDEARDWARGEIRTSS